MLLAGGGIAAQQAVERLLPRGDLTAEGLIVDGVAVGRGRPLRPLIEGQAAQRLAHRITVRHQDQALISATVAELGGTCDSHQAVVAVAAVGRAGSIWQRFDDALQARRGALAVSLPCEVPVAELAKRLAAFKLAHDRKPRPARWDFTANAPTDHEDGLLVDVHATLVAVDEAAHSGKHEVDVVVRRLTPAATRDVVAQSDKSEVISKYSTRFADFGRHVGRSKNVYRAASGIDGLVLMPRQIVSFNALVGPRSIKNGFAEAGEIYKGEMRKGIGGGTCQVASTFHASAYLGGLQVVERSPHSRPSGYIPIGLDATVSYPHVDLKLQNSLSFPVIVHAVADKGTLTMELLGRQKVVSVEFKSATVGIKPYKRKIKQAHWLQPGRVIHKQKGIRGITVRKIRKLRFIDGTDRLEETEDIYPPTNEIYIISPDVDVDEKLPPLPPDIKNATGA